MSTAQQGVWYLLVQADGSAFNNCTAAKVSVSSTADIDDLRDAVKLKNANDLSTVDARNLKVFNNKNELDGKSIDVEALVTQMGLSKDEALLILVPESRVSGREQGIFFY
jgi:hypothetical protein